MPRALILMGSPSDKEWCIRIAEELSKFGIDSQLRIASAHKIPEHTLEIVKDSDCDVIITVAGRSNALSGLVDANTSKPVIACPPLNEQNILYDIYSSIRMPSGVAPMLVLNPENAALAVAKIIGIKDEGVRKRVEEYQKNQQKKLIDADTEITDGQR